MGHYTSIDFNIRNIVVIGWLKTMIHHPAVMAVNAVYNAGALRARSSKVQPWRTRKYKRRFASVLLQVCKMFCRYMGIVLQVQQQRHGKAGGKKA
jgi:hypothetical protein